MELLEIYPIPVLIIDYILGVIMWTLLGRFVLDLFIAPDNDMVIARVFRQITNPVIRFFKRITPAFLVPILVPVYVAWWFYMIRFYVLPLIFFNQFGTLSFPLENDLVKLIFGG
jgi:uncharacterized protein YggT (Ycf19 family)